MAVRGVCLILAGGASRRMGMDKLSLPRYPCGPSILHHVVQTGLAVCAEAWLLTPPDAGAWTALAEKAGGRLRIIPDAAWHEGPLRALAHAWPDGDEAERVWVLAGDLPGLVPHVLTSLADALQQRPWADAVLAVRDGHWQPLLGCYRPGAGEALRRAASAGKRRLLAAMDGLRLEGLDAAAMGVPDWVLRPVHTPADYEQWLTWFRHYAPGHGERS
ncbi:MAG: molybdenum cofactor guanylyltransferase [Thermoflavifilum sp.]|nr:molybdenum cofactor guanylyltransferase [Thermoflavifilum sp.]MCL6513672.1 molybdenum cofactor guanylyltransferase [Alicyclobacillus sp.]